MGKRTNPARPVARSDLNDLEERVYRLEQQIRCAAQCGHRFSVATITPEFGEPTHGLRCCLCGLEIET
ncbi:MAG TPA: hypothetical protein PLP01_16255 [Phycisphaerae bacterium]|nr:hypothetical protein [Phycisphaerae bacterium]HOI56803.1 hypothetical protein [Phycisphaerae bacterium]